MPNAMTIFGMLVLAGCVGRAPAVAEPGAVEIVFLDAQRGVVARGELTLPVRLPPGGQTFTGAWQLVSSAASFPARATGNGTVVGHVRDDGVRIDLNPGNADNNVLLNGTLQGGAFSGKWTHATIAGGREMGTFTAAPPRRE